MNKPEARQVQAGDRLIVSDTWNKTCEPDFKIISPAEVLEVIEGKTSSGIGFVVTNYRLESMLADAQWFTGKSEIRAIIG